MGLHAAKIQTTRHVHVIVVPLFVLMMDATMPHSAGCTVRKLLLTVYSPFFI